MTHNRYWRCDIARLSGMLEDGSVTSETLLDSSLERIERLNPALNAFSHIDPYGARQAARAADHRRLAGRRVGPLDGIPVAIKDNLFVAGMPARWGSLLFRDHVPAQDDICVERLRAAGCVLIGKCTTPEFALSGRTESRLDGITRNPWDTALTPGGSSGGAVAAVAAGMVPLAVGTDAGGSTRIPAAYTNLVGLRSSNGRIPRRHGFPPMAIDFQAIGPIARSVADIEALYATLAGPDGRDPASTRLPPCPPVNGRPLRVGLFTSVNGEMADDAVVQAVEHAAGQLTALGVIVEPCSPPFDLDLLRGIWSTLTAAGAARVAARFPDRWPTEVTAPIATVIERGLALSAASYVEALDRLAVFRADVSANWGEFDALLMPTAPTPAWRAEAEHPAEIGGRPGSVAAQGIFCGWVNAVGYPAISVPGTPHADGRPIGVQIAAPFGHDNVVLHLARLLEQAAPWAERWPALSD